jgi:cytochrome c-type biogenesis protein CcmH
VNPLALAFSGLLALALASTEPAPRSGSSIGAPRGIPLSGPALDARTEDLGGLLRCPVCQGLSVADSPATMARNMKAEVREKLAAGYDQEQILQYFEHSYGEFVRLEPPLRGVNWLVWFGPLAGLVAGAAAIAWKLRGSKGNAGAPEKAESGGSGVPSRDALPDDPRLAAAVRQVRRLAYGWPEGASPETHESSP